MHALFEDSGKFLAGRILSEHFVRGIPADIDRRIRETFPILLPEYAMRA